MKQLLDSGAHTLEAREHFLCVYGDNFIQSVKYKITLLPLSEFCQEAVDKITTVEPVLSEKRNEMSTFQKEYMDLKRRYHPTVLPNINILL